MQRSRILLGILVAVTVVTGVGLRLMSPLTGQVAGGAPVCVNGSPRCQSGSPACAFQTTGVSCASGSPDCPGGSSPLCCQAPLCPPPPRDCTLIGTYDAQGCRGCPRCVVPADNAGPSICRKTGGSSSRSSSKSSSKSSSRSSSKSSSSRSSSRSSSSRSSSRSGGSASSVCSACAEACGSRSSGSSRSCATESTCVQVNPTQEMIDACRRQQPPLGPHYQAPINSGQGPVGSADAMIRNVTRVGGFGTQAAIVREAEPSWAANNDVSKWVAAVPTVDKPGEAWYYANLSYPSADMPVPAGFFISMRVMSHGPLTVLRLDDVTVPVPPASADGWTYVTLRHGQGGVVFNGFDLFYIAHAYQQGDQGGLRVEFLCPVPRPSYHCTPESELCSSGASQSSLQSCNECIAQFCTDRSSSSRSAGASSKSASSMSQSASSRSRSSKSASSRSSSRRSASSAACGNCIKESGEQCEDGNVINGDGCSSTCRIENGWRCRDVPPDDLPACRGRSSSAAGNQSSAGGGTSSRTAESSVASSRAVSSIGGGTTGGTGGTTGGGPACLDDDEADVTYPGSVREYGTLVTPDTCRTGGGEALNYVDEQVCRLEGRVTDTLDCPAGTRCSGGACTVVLGWQPPTTPNCTDSDGFNPRTKGTAAQSGYTDTDVCMDGLRVQETYCGGGTWTNPTMNQVRKTVVLCPGGTRCTDGACGELAYQPGAGDQPRSLFARILSFFARGVRFIAQLGGGSGIGGAVERYNLTHVCVDSDGPPLTQESIQEKGTATLDGQVLRDFCVGTSVRDYICRNSAAQQHMVAEVLQEILPPGTGIPADCSPGTQCVDGGCAAPGQQPPPAQLRRTTIWFSRFFDACTDPDSALGYTGALAQRTTVTGGGEAYEDTCESPSILHEFQCNGTQDRGPYEYLILLDRAPCPSGTQCRDGACVTGAAGSSSSAGLGPVVSLCERDGSSSSSRSASSRSSSRSASSRSESSRSGSSRSGSVSSASSRSGSSASRSSLSASSTSSRSGSSISVSSGSSRSGSSRSISESSGSSRSSTSSRSASSLSGSALSASSGSSRSSSSRSISESSGSSRSSTSSRSASSRSASSASSRSASSRSGVSSSMVTGVHRECRSNRCITVAGPGPSVCSFDDECNVSHAACVSNQCIRVPGPGSDVCGSSADCSQTHAACRSNRCVPVPGAGSNECQSDAQCRAVHAECRSNRCVVVAGTGSDRCGNDADCGGATTGGTIGGTQGGATGGATGGTTAGTQGGATGTTGGTFGSSSSVVLTQMLRERCGDAIVQPPEACDDGNRVDSDTCTNLCLLARAEPCTADVQCSDGLCIDGLCQSCFNDVQCGAGRICLAGVCSVCGDGIVTPPEACDDANRVDIDSCTNRCGFGPGVSCTSSFQCESHLCLNGVCQPCTGDAQCPATERCLNGLCVPVGACREDRDCGAGAFCIGGRCQECRTAQDCAEGFDCEVGRCVRSSRCRTNRDCAPGDRCVSGRCVMCVSDRDCPAGHACRGGQCIAQSRAPGGLPGSLLDIPFAGTDGDDGGAMFGTVLPRQSRGPAGETGPAALAVMAAGAAAGWAWVRRRKR